MVVMGFVIGLYLIFFKPSLILLFYFMIGFWAFALILVFIGLGYYIYDSRFNKKNYDFENVLRCYLDNIFVE